MVDLPRWWHDVIKDALIERGMVVVERSPTVDLQAEVKRSGVNVVITQMIDGVVPQSVGGLVGMSPVAMIGVDARGTRTIVQMGDVSFKGLLEITRVAAVAVMNSEPI